MLNISIGKWSGTLASFLFYIGLGLMFLAFLLPWTSLVLPLRFVELILQMFGTAMALGIGFIGMAVAAGLVSFIAELFVTPGQA